QQGALAVRLHGAAKRAEGARRRPQARLAVRYHGDVVLRLAAGAETRGAIRDAEMAGPPVYWAFQIGQRCDRLFPDPHRAGGRGRYPGDDLKSDPGKCTPAKVES